MQYVSTGLTRNDCPIINTTGNLLLALKIIILLLFQTENVLDFYFPDDIESFGSQSLKKLFKNF